eukprot:3215339-Prymnesium_polylepis.2
MSEPQARAASPFTCQRMQRCRVRACGAIWPMAEKLGGDSLHGRGALCGVARQDVCTTSLLSHETIRLCGQGFRPNGSDRDR